jgi:hypothetical protein
MFESFEIYDIAHFYDKLCRFCQTGKNRLIFVMSGEKLFSFLFHKIMNFFIIKVLSNIEKKKD